MAKLIEAPDLTSKKRTGLIEAPDLTKQTKQLVKAVKTLSPVGKESNDLVSIRQDISELNQLVKQVIKAEIQTNDVVRALSKERQNLISDLDKLGDKVNEISKTGISQKTIKTLKADVSWLISEIDRLDEQIAKARPVSDYISFGGGISKTEAVAAVKADGSIVLSEPVSTDFKKVTNIYIEPVSGELVVIHEA